ncbi:MAG TPA: prolipoprotein diacylglyceryl transferase [Sphingomonadales bacterium]
MFETALAGALPFPDIDPVLVEIGPLAIRWYSLAYIGGLILGWAYMARLIREPNPPCRREDLDDFVLWAMLGVVGGGRLGYVLFYNLDFYIANPAAALRLWDGGMSFHGGLLGMILVMLWFCRRRGISFLRFTDRIACVAPIGLFLGRIANFINGELYGRPTDAPWGIVFPGGGPLPRHPSQLYEAAMEGLLLFVVLNLLFHFTNARRRPGLLGGLFLLGYGLSRILVETLREPDAHIGFIYGSLTMGQILSLPAFLAGGFLVWRAFARPPLPQHVPGKPHAERP